MKPEQLSIRDAIVFWNPETGEIKVTHFGPPSYGRIYSRDEYPYTFGACNPEVKKGNVRFRREEVMKWFHLIVVGHGVDVVATHREFLKIEEYRDSIDPEVGGN